jgi:hypothetical protein
MPIVECKDCDKRFYYNPSWSGSGYPQQDRCTECCQGRTPESVRSRQEWEDHHPFASKKYDTSPYRVGERAGVAIHDGGCGAKPSHRIVTVREITPRGTIVADDGYTFLNGQCYGKSSNVTEIVPLTREIEDECLLRDIKKDFAMFWGQEKDDISLETVVSLLDTLMAWKKDQAKRVSRSVR